MLRTLLKWLTGGFLDRALGTVDKYVESQTEREKLRADVTQAYIKTRPDWLKAGGFWLVFIGGVPFVFHAAAVCVYSVLWHRNGPWPVSWDVAALPPPFDEWQGLVIMAWLGVVGLMGLRR